MARNRLADGLGGRGASGWAAFIQSSFAPAIQISLRAAFAAGTAVGFAKLLQLQHPIYALIAAVIVSDLSPSQTRQLGLFRLAGSAVGALIGILISLLLTSAAWTIALGVFLAILISYLLRLGRAAKLAGYVCGIVILSHSGNAISYGAYRLAETVLGIVMAIIVSLIPKLIKNDEPKPLS